VSHGPGEEDGLIDLSGLSLRDLDKLGESALSLELRRLLLSGSTDDETISGFTDSV
jgi:FXSXX-COOH protein